MCAGAHESHEAAGIDPPRGRFGDPTRNPIAGRAANRGLTPRRRPARSRASACVQSDEGGIIGLTRVMTRS